MGFAEQVMDLEIRLEEEESLELIQILSQMYKVPPWQCRSPLSSTCRRTCGRRTTSRRS
jgi:hypothetical protein